MIFPDCESGSTGWVQVAMAGEELGAVHERGLDHHLCHQEAKLRGAGAQPKGQGGNQLQVTFLYLCVAHAKHRHHPKNKTFLKGSD